LAAVKKPDILALPPPSTPLQLRRCGLLLARSWGQSSNNPSSPLPDRKHGGTNQLSAAGNQVLLNGRAGFVEW